MQPMINLTLHSYWLLLYGKNCVWVSQWMLREMLSKKMSKMLSKILREMLSKKMSLPLCEQHQRVNRRKVGAACFLWSFDGNFLLRNWEILRKLLTVQDERNITENHIFFSTKTIPLKIDLIFPEISPRNIVRYDSTRFFLRWGQ